MFCRAVPHLFFYKKRLLFIAILDWRHVIQFAECAAEMLYCLIADGESNVFHRHISVFEKRSRLFHSYLRQVFAKRLSGFFADILADIRFAQMKLCRHIRKCYRLIIGLHKINHIHQPFVFTDLVFFMSGSLLTHTQSA